MVIKGDTFGATVRCQLYRLQALSLIPRQRSARERLRQDALAAWANYQATGKHVTEEEADIWLAELEAGKDVDPPECHG